jgi:CheY-like chemotaxis protein
MDDHRPRILLIDDQLTNLDALKAMLMTECALAVAHSGSQGLKLAAECRPDVILINLMMPRPRRLRDLSTAQGRPAAARHSAGFRERAG